MKYIYIYCIILPSIDIFYIYLGQLKFHKSHTLEASKATDSKLAALCSRALAASVSPNKVSFSPCLNGSSNCGRTSIGQPSIFVGAKNRHSGTNGFLIEHGSFLGSLGYHLWMYYDDPWCTHIMKSMLRLFVNFLWRCAFKVCHRNLASLLPDMASCKNSVCK